MITVQQGEVYRAARFKAGANDKGGWALVAISDPNNSRKTVTMFIDNLPQELREGQMFKVAKINTVKIGYKRDKDQQWKPDTTLRVDIEPIAFEGDVDDGELPWDVDGDDWQLPL